MSKTRCCGPVSLPSRRCTVEAPMARHTGHGYLSNVYLSIGTPLVRLPCRQREHVFPFRPSPSGYPSVAGYSAPLFAVSRLSAPLFAAGYGRSPPTACHLFLLLRPIALVHSSTITATHTPLSSSACTSKHPHSDTLRCRAALVHISIRRSLHHSMDHLLCCSVLAAQVHTSIRRTSPNSTDHLLCFSVSIAHV